MQLQARQLDQAQASLERYLALAREHGNGQTGAAQAQAFLMLSQVAEARGDWAAANSWLDRIEDGDALVTAQIRRATLLGRQGRLDEAMATLASLPERSAEERRRKGLAEAQLWRDLQRHPEALAAYARLVERFPDDPDLVYEQAMAADRAGQLPEMERLLRQLMQRHPDYHHAYNALGYALADRNERLPEAKGLIQKALQAAPNDAYILDSLGWVEYRLGNLEEARRILQDAYRRQPDAEIAAHLGEVLWQLQQRQAALDIWREGLLLNPDNQTLVQTLRRFQVKP
jgi:tetratricopeptide (TPR) repeat protein